MIAKKEESPKTKNRILRIIPILIILLILVGLPWLFLNYQSKRSGLTRMEVIHGITSQEQNQITSTEKDSEKGGEKINFLTSKPIGQSITEPPLISNIAVTDLDNDGLLDVVVCDCRSNSVSWIRQSPVGNYTETVLAKGLIAPAHVQVADFDKDGDNDVMVAVLGMLFPNNDKIGSVVVLENEGNGSFVKHIIVDRIARVSDVRAGDLDNDGDMDLAVAQFGYDDGETRWIENKGGWKFESHILQNISGGINVELIDIEKDGDLDIISLISQEWEEMYCFVNEGKGSFKTKLLYKSSNEDFGSSGISICDLDKDGDPDLLYTNGDAFDYIPPRPRPWHGVQWLENKGNLTFEYHRICTFPGSYNARPYDIDQDGDLDLFVVSGFNTWEKSDAQSLVWLENDGKMQFRKHAIANKPTHILTLELGDFNNDGLMDLATGGMHAYPPFDRLGRITLWTNNGTLGQR